MSLRNCQIIFVSSKPSANLGKDFATNNDKGLTGGNVGDS